MRDLDAITVECAEVARVAIHEDRYKLSQSEWDDVEVLADLTRDTVAEVLANERLTDGEYDGVLDAVLDMLRCNGDSLECVAAGCVADEPLGRASQ